MMGLVSTINCVIFLCLFAVWTKKDLLNFSIKCLFLFFAIINASPAWTFLQQNMH